MFFFYAVAIQGPLHRLVFAIHGILLSMRNTAIIHKEYLNLLPITIFFNTEPHRIEFVVVSLNIDLLQ